MTVTAERLPQAPQASFSCRLRDELQRITVDKGSHCRTVVADWECKAERRAQRTVTPAFSKKDDSRMQNTGMTTCAIRTIEWIGAIDTGCLRLIDQTLLPETLAYLDCENVETVWDAIKRLSVRGAPAIGIAAAMGVVLGVRNYEGTDRQGFPGKDGGGR